MVEAAVITITSYHYWLYYCNEVELLSNWEGLPGMMEKSLADIENKKLQKIRERTSNYKWKLTHIKDKNNQICDTLSRLCTQICLYTRDDESRSPRLLPMSKRASVRKKQLEEENTLVIKITDEGKKHKHRIFRNVKCIRK